MSGNLDQDEEKEEDEEQQEEVLTANFAALLTVQTHKGTIPFTAVWLGSPSWAVFVVVFTFCCFE